MNCEGCINKGRACLSCDGKRMKALPVVKPERQLSAWEKRWIRWVKKNKR